MPARPCLDCGALTTHTSSRCTQHQRERGQQRRATSPQASIESTTTWQRIRTLARRRDNGCTQAHHGDCRGRLEVHHLQAISRGGDPYDLNNITTLCQHHHRTLERTKADGKGGHHRYLG